MTVYPDDVVIAVLHGLWRERGVKQFTADREQLHRAFFALKQQTPELFAPLQFREKGLFPESEALDQALANLEASGLLRRHNETPRCYLIQEQLGDAFSRFVSHRLQAMALDEASIDRAAQELSA